ncbi:MAG TPA: hypothetical protein VFW78_09630 [Bacteroidia bacterium]|nr:hypothetical protein [Bacteroidia bacterium]
MDQESEQPEHFRLYSQRSISIATYFGGPLAAGILARRNFINLGKERSGKSALIIGIFSTILVFTSIFLIPGELIDRIPPALIPLIYTGIIYFVIEKFQGADLKEHKENKRPFYSAWKAAGTGAICLVLIIGSIVTVAYLTPDEFDSQKYYSGIETFKENESAALSIYSKFESATPLEIVSFIDSAGIPSWKQNLMILDEMDNLDGLTDNLKRQNDLLRKYSSSQIELFELIKKSIYENTNKYDHEMQNIQLEIEKILKQIQN